MPTLKETSFFLLILMVVILLASPAFGQWRTQTIVLQPGWNAVYLEVQPDPSESDVALQGIPVESVWAWNRQFSSVQFIQDASTLSPGQPEWLTYFPPDAEKAFLNNLFIIQGGKSYLIKLKGTDPANWVVTGKSVVRPLDWIPDSFNLVGFNIDPSNPPTFTNFFNSSSAHSGAQFYTMNTAGQWIKISSPSSEAIQPGKAYWIYCKGSSQFRGPISITMEQSHGIDFGRTLTEQIIRVKNGTTQTKQITLTKQASGTPPGGAMPILAGDVPLSYWNSSTLAWADFSGTLQAALSSGQEFSLRIAVRRPDMNPSGVAGAVYQSLLEVKDGQGSKLSIPVLAKGMNYTEGSTPQTLAKGMAMANATVPDKRAGLWVGTATLDKVSHAASSSDKVTPQPTSSEMQIRLIVHVDASGQARLLQHVTMMWKEGTKKPDPNDPTKLIVDEPGRFVLIARDDLITQFSGAAVRDGAPFGRRISSAAFSFPDPVSMAGNFDSALQSGDIILDYNDPLNPFKHKYHPDHDNLDFDFQTVLPNKKESYTITRTIQLAFTQTDPDGLQVAGWGDTQVGGIYSESITGLHREVLNVAGKFRLHRASNVAVLNDGL